jgi:hypothetical protein
MLLKMINKGLLIAVAVWLNISAFYYVAISTIGILDKAIVFASTMLLDMTIMWLNMSQRIDEIVDRVAKARIELIVADIEIAHKEMFSDLNSMIDTVHNHIKIAKEQLDGVPRYL